MAVARFPTRTSRRRETAALGRFAGRLTLIALFIAFAFALWRLSEVLLLLFGGILIAIALRAGADALGRLTRLPGAAALAVVVAGGLAAFAATFWVFGSMAAVQLQKVIATAPAGIETLMSQLNRQPFGPQTLVELRKLNIQGSTGWMTSVATTAMASASTALGYTLVIFFVAVYLAAEPKVYVNLVLKLTPPDQRAAVGHVFDVTGDILRRWIVGRFIVMAAIGVLSATGLYFLGIKGPIVLGLMGGLLCFIPFVGAILAAVPATLVALTQGPVHALAVVAMYWGVHAIEGNFITPLVQAKTTSLAPVISLLSTVVFGVLLGAAGAFLATPLTLAFMAIVECIYVRGWLHDRTSDIFDGKAVD